MEINKFIKECLKREHDETFQKWKREVLMNVYQPERTNPEDASVKTYYRSDDGIYEPLETCICDVPNSANK